MSEIHYFQRYSQKENVITNNTLLLFSRLYNHSPQKFNLFLKFPKLFFLLFLFLKKKGTVTIPDPKNPQKGKFSDRTSGKFKTKNFETQYIQDTNINASNARI